MKTKKINKKIIVVSRYWPPNFFGGGEISTYYVCKQLSKMGYEISIATPNPNNNKDFKFIKLINPNSIYELFEERYFNRITANQKFTDGVFWASDFYGAAFLKNMDVKKIATVRDHWPICNKTLNILKDYSSCDHCSLNNIIKCYGILETNIQKKISRTFKYLYNRKFRKSILPKFDHVVFISNYIANKITSLISLKNYSVIYNPLSPEFMKNDGLKNFINKNIIFSGYVVEFKGIDILLKAMKELLRYDKNFDLIIIGEGYLDKYKNMVNKLSLSKNVKFTGKIKNEETVKYYDRSTLAVIPSLCFETFGRTVIEGMARKCIAIATNRGGPAEIIKNGGNGFLFEKGNYKQLAKIIINLYQNQEMMKKIQEEARKFAIKSFSPEKIAKQYDLIFQRYS